MASDSIHPLRVLHVLGRMDRGGIETWLLQALRKIDRRRLAIDIGVTKPGEGIYDSEVRQLGSKLFSLPHPKQPWQFAANLQDVLHKQGPYDVVHSHCYLYSGVVLKVAAKSGVPMRIAHVHPHVDVHEKRRFRSIYRRLMTRWISRFATQVLAPSRHSLDSFRDICDCRHIATSVLYNGVELERFSVSVDEQAVRRKHGLSVDLPLVICVARFSSHKNHAQVFRVADRINRQQPRVQFALVGSHGPCLAAVRRQAASRDDVSVLTDVAHVSDLLQAADVLFHPSLNEGFGVVAIEAAAAGLPIVATDLPTIREACPPLMHPFLISPNDDLAAAENIRNLLAFDDSSGYQQHALRQFAETFSMDRSVAALHNIYGLNKTLAA